jgi:hypothetical protein
MNYLAEHRIADYLSINRAPAAGSGEINIV